ncbi:MAG: hypothetical protein JO307_27575 [Bryobacterales bacterium]|nr:hypothetical protein [Bryobacterales bacterium]MBV9401148.1 hypothetical protein [Bryobacterales bacterium]
MVSRTGSTQTDSVANIPLNQPVSTASTDSFAQQLAATLQQYLNPSQNGSPNGSQVELDIQPASGQGSADGYIVTVKTVPGTPAAAAVESAAQPSTIQSTQPGSTASPADGYVQVPFGAGNITVPSLATELAWQNAASVMLTPAQILNQDQVSLAGDPMAGQTIHGTNLKWDDLTQNQQLAYIYASDYGLPAGQTIQDYLTANYGPHIMANAPSNNPYLFSNG